MRYSYQQHPNFGLNEVKLMECVFALASRYGKYLQNG